MLLLRSAILAKTINIASTSPQQSQPISPPSFLQCTYLHQWRVPILICNISQLKPKYVQFHIFSVQAQTEMIKGRWSERLYCHMYLPRKNLSSSKYNSDIVFSVFLSLDQNLMKLNDRNIYLINSLDKKSNLIRSC